MTVKVYLAGKISDPERAAWRDQLLSVPRSYVQRRAIDIDKRENQDVLFGNEGGGPSRALLQWPLAPNTAVLGEFDYVGPYLMDAVPIQKRTLVADPTASGVVRVELDSGSSASEHGSMGTGQHGDWAGWTGGGEPWIYDQCFAAVRRCDVLLAYLDADDLYGTFIEIGWALAWDKVVAIAAHDSDSDHTVEGAYPAGRYGDLLARSGVVWIKRDSLESGLRQAIAVSEQRSLATMPYSEYLKTAHWQDVRQAALGRAAGHCQLCGARAGLDVHHNTYERRGAELPSDVIALCRPCHAHHHGKTAPGGGR